MANLPGSQQAILDSLARQGGQQPINGQATTIASLVNRGLIEHVSSNVYRVTDAGKAYTSNEDGN